MLTAKLRFMFLRTALFSVLLTGSHFAASAQTPAGWQSVSPGFSAEVLLSHSNVMWAAGSAETIAVSIDGGQHWQKKHEDPNGGYYSLLHLSMRNLAMRLEQGHVY